MGSKRVRGKLFFSIILMGIVLFALPLHASVQNEGMIKVKLKTVRLPFIENRGQARSSEVAYYVQTFGGTVFVTKRGEVVYSLPKHDAKKSMALREIFVGRKSAHVKGIMPSSAKVSYFIGKDKSRWRTNLPTYMEVSLGEIYQGIDLVLKARGDNVEKVFTVQPGSDPRKIRIRLEGAERLEVGKEGILKVVTSLGEVSFTKPVAYQEINGKRKLVEASYCMTGRRTYGFEVGAYDRSRPLVIDPLLASTYLGKSETDIAYALTIDGSGNIYVAGKSNSNDFPTTSGAYDEIHNGDYDAFISKFTGNLKTLLASTYLGGSDHDQVNAIALGSSGDVYVVGETRSNNFPTTSGAYDESHNGNQDVFVSKLSADLKNLLASTYLGGSSWEYVHSYSLVFDGSGNLYVVGETQSSDFPTVGGAYDTTLGGSRDVFVCKLSSNLGLLSDSTYLGGSGSEYAGGIACDSSGNAFVGGATGSTDFPTTTGAYDESHNGGTWDAFVCKLSSNLGALSISTYLGGSGFDYIYALVLDSSGNVCVTGKTSSNDFPTTSGVFDSSYNGGWDCFVSKLKADLTALLASTYFGGSDNWNG